MLHALITLAADKAPEPSKTLFYIAGGALALWAVLVSFIGIRGHESWPGTEGAARGIMGLSAVLVAFAMAAAVITS